MRIGIYFTAGKKNGGVYQYSLGFLEALTLNPDNDYVIITTSPDIPKKYLHDPRFTLINLASGDQAKYEQWRTWLANVVGRYLGIVMSLLYRLRLFFVVNLAMRYSQRAVLQAIDSAQLDLLIFPAGSDLSYLVNIPTIVAVHDLQHKLNPQFKEVSYGGRWEYRENYYSQTCAKSLRILVDSVVGKEDVLSCYPGTDPSKIIILPFLPTPYLEPSITPKKVASVLKQFKITSPYIYYPAHFWSHKNHMVLVRALKLLHSQGKKVSLIMTGAKEVDFSTYQDVMDYAKKHGLSRYVKFLGYVENIEVSALYKGALALTMPTFFGPTNIPVLEAWTMGTPVVYSDIRGCREQLGQAGLLADPTDPGAWAHAITRILTEPALVPTLTKLGHTRVASWTMADFSALVDTMLKKLVMLK